MLESGLEAFLSKLSIYRAILLICLAVVAYVWPTLWLIYGLWAGSALMGAATLAFFPEERQGTGIEIMLSGALAPLRVWLGLWNGFYVWTDLDHDYWNRTNE
ncbi:hypothetical protein [Shinella zoogloeoides]|uniref:hypothetical protein n=1 Tax=Shinella zoogloeoides TaxID=352475 RepID=UPI00299E9B4A|nr:hypothetical protein [Shinella zoogloeoides]